MQFVLAKNGNVHEKKWRHCKNNMASLRSENEIVVLRLIYNI